MSARLQPPARRTRAFVDSEQDELDQIVIDHRRVAKARETPVYEGQC